MTEAPRISFSLTYSHVSLSLDRLGKRSGRLLSVDPDLISLAPLCPYQSDLITLHPINLNHLVLSYKKKESEYKNRKTYCSCAICKLFSVAVVTMVAADAVFAVPGKLLNHGTTIALQLTFIQSFSYVSENVLRQASSSPFSWLSSSRHWAQIAMLLLTRSSFAR